MSLIFGGISLIWHVVVLVLYFTNNGNTMNYPITDAM